MMNSLNQRAGSDSLFAVGLGLILAAGLAVVISTGRVTVDDAYITYRYADNFARGEGLVYNVGERVCGTTTPLTALALGIMMRLGLPLEAGIAALTILAYALMAWSAWALLGKEGLPWGALALGALLISHRQLYYLFGFETPLAVGMVLVCFALFRRERYATALICSAFVVGIRPDAGLVGVVLILSLLQKDRRRLWPALGWAGLVFAPLYLSFVFYFDVWAPNTLAAKSGMGLDNPMPFRKGALGFFADLYFGKDFIPTGALALIGTVLIVRRGYSALLLYVLLYFLAFSLLDPSYYFFWYRFPFWIFAAFTTALAIGWLAEQRTHRASAWNRWGRHATAGALLTGAALIANLLDRNPDFHESGRYEVYREIADHIRGMNRPPGRLLLEEIGIIGYLLPEWKIVDRGGLIHRRPIEEILGEAPPEYAVQQKPDATFKATPTRDAFRYAQVERFSNARFSCGFYRLKHDEPEIKTASR